MRTIWKYEVPADNVELPEIFTFRHFEKQGNSMCVWVEVDTETTRKLRFDFVQTGTGHYVPREAIYVGTWLDGLFVWHMWAVKK